MKVIYSQHYWCFAEQFLGLPPFLVLRLPKKPEDSPADVTLQY